MTPLNHKPPSQSRVLAFGTFDLLHPGHLSFLRQAAALGGHLTVVVTRDREVRRVKRKPPVQSAIDRLSAVLTTPGVDEAHLADHQPDSYNLLATLDYDILAVGYDQTPSDEDILALLQQAQKPHVRLVRLQAFVPQAYKTSRIRDRLNG